MHCSQNMDWLRLRVNTFDVVFETANQIKKCTGFGFRAFIERFSCFVCHNHFATEMNEEYNWMLSPEVLKNNNSNVLSVNGC